jgi:hypothetical protein
MLNPLIAEHLTSDDDPELWELATTALIAEAETLVHHARDSVCIQIGCCHHWISPHHPIRWAAGGGFAWPFGYDKTTTGWSYRAMPEFTWSQFLQWTGEGWEQGRGGHRGLVFRIAIPARTARHAQAAIHTIWTPRSPISQEKAVRLFGFRKKDGNWSLTASEEISPRRKPRR